MRAFAVAGTLACVFVVVAVSAGAEPLTYEIEVLKRRGEPTPTRGGYHSFRDPVLLDAERLGFLGTLEALFRATPEGVIDLIAETGGGIPGGFEGVLTDLGSASNNAAGEVAFHAEFRTTDGTNLSRLVVTSPLGLQTLADSRDLGTLGSNPRFRTFPRQAPSINAAGDVATALEVEGRDPVVLFSADRSFTVIDDTVNDRTAKPELGDDGSVVYFQDLDAQDSLWLWRPGAGTQLLLREADPAPVPTGGVINRLDPDEFALSPSGAYVAVCARTQPETGPSRDAVLLRRLLESVSESEPNDDVSSADVGLLGIEYKGSINIGGDVDLVRFVAFAGTELVARTVLGTLTDSVLTLRDADGALLAFDDDGGGGLASRIELTLPTDGLYFLEVGGFFGGRGSYTLEIGSDEFSSFQPLLSEEDIGEASLCGGELDVDDTGSVAIRRSRDLFVVPFGFPPIYYGTPCGPSSPRTPSFTAFPEVAVLCGGRIVLSSSPGDSRELAGFETLLSSLELGFEFDRLRARQGTLVFTGATSMVVLDPLDAQSPGETVAALGDPSLGGSRIRTLEGPLGVLDGRLLFGALLLPGAPEAPSGWHILWGNTPEELLRLAGPGDRVGFGFILESLADPLSGRLAPVAVTGSKVAVLAEIASNDPNAPNPTLGRFNAVLRIEQSGQSLAALTGDTVPGEGTLTSIGGVALDGSRTLIGATLERFVDAEEVTGVFELEPLSTIAIEEEPDGTGRTFSVIGDPNSNLDDPNFSLEVGGESVAFEARRTADAEVESGIFVHAGSGSEARILRGDPIPDCTGPIDPLDPNSPLGPCRFSRVALEGIDPSGRVLFAGTLDDPNQPVEGLFLADLEDLSTVVRRNDPIPGESALFAFGGEFISRPLKATLGPDGAVLFTEGRGIYRATVCTDPDGDELCGSADNCPNVPNPDQADTDENDLGDACQCGDVNGDGSTNVTDALAIARGEVLQSDPNFEKCDVDGNGSCNTADALAIARGEVGSALDAQLCPAFGASAAP